MRLPGAGAFQGTRVEPGMIHSASHRMSRGWNVPLRGLKFADILKPDKIDASQPVGFYNVLEMFRYVLVSRQSRSDMGLSRHSVYPAGLNGVTGVVALDIGVSDELIPLGRSVTVMRRKAQEVPAVEHGFASVNEFARPRDEFIEAWRSRSEEHTSELQSLAYLVCRLLLEKKKRTTPVTRL